MERKDVNLNDVSPMMREYLKTKSEYEGIILFYRLGDFYEMFFDDAILASHELELTLTGKQAGLKERIPMCGIPHHAVNVYLEKLIEKGYKVAICEQMEDPKNAKGIVKREVIQIVSAGTLTSPEIVNEKDLKRFAVIDLFDVIFWDSNDVSECYEIYDINGKENFKGIYDYKQQMYLDEVDILDITGCQIHSP